MNPADFQDNTGNKNKGEFLVTYDSYRDKKQYIYT